MIKFFIVLSVILCCFSLEEWNSTEVFFETFLNASDPYPVTPPPWLIPIRPVPKPSGLKTHRHEFFDAVGFKHMVTYSNYWKWPKYIYYINLWEGINFDIPLRKWFGGKRRIPTWQSEERKYYYINDTATSKSVWVSPNGQGLDYDTFYKDYRSTWFYNDSMIFKYTNDTAENIPAWFMAKKRKQRGNIPGRWDDHFPVPSKKFWWGLRRNRGRLLHRMI